MNDGLTIPRLEGVTADVALLLHGLGFSIFPVPLGSKTPTVSWKRWQTERATDDMVREWFEHPTNIAIVTGAISNLVVIDCDSDHALRLATRTLPYTPRQVTTSKGYHLYYRHPGAPIRNRARISTGDTKIAIDVRGDGGFVVGPWSLHASGATYHCVGDWDAPASNVPVFDPAWLQSRHTATHPRGPQSERGSDTETTSVIERARRYLDSIPVPQIGQGSDSSTLYAAARLVRGFALPDTDAVELLDRWAGGRPGWDRAWIATKVANAHRFGTERVGGLL